MQKQIAYDLGKSRMGVLRVLPKKPDPEKLSRALPLLAKGVRGNDAAAIKELQKIVLGERSYSAPARAAILAGIEKNEGLRGFYELYLHRSSYLRYHPSEDDSMVRGTIFSGVVSSLLLPKPAAVALPEDESAFMASYLSRPALDAARGKHSHDRDYFYVSSLDYRLALEKKLEDFLKGRTLSDAAFDVFRSMAERYVAMRPQHCDHVSCSDFAIAHSQLEALVRTMPLITDRRLEPFLEALVSLDYNAPVGHGDLFTLYDSAQKKRLPAPSLGMDFVPSAERLAANPLFWVNDMGRWLMSSVASAIEILARKDPDRTRKVRLDLLSQTERMDGNKGNILYHLVYTFRSEADKDALRASGSVEAKNILDGRYENAAWAI